MKLNLGKMSSLLLLAVSCLLLLPQNSFAVENEDYIVENLKANDVPYDDGGGLVLSWKPLPKG